MAESDGGDKRPQTIRFPETVHEDMQILCAIRGESVSEFVTRQTIFGLVRELKDADMDLQAAFKVAKRHRVRNRPTKPKKDST